jgi:hypothetical protein
LALYDTLANYCSPERDKGYSNSLDFDYGLPPGTLGADANNEFALVSPSRIDESMEDMVEELFRKSRKSKKPKNANAQQSSLQNDDGKKVSPSTIYGDMPWAKCYLPCTNEMRKRRLDWEKLYKNFDLLGNGLGEGNFEPNIRMHLQNRCRIWGVCTRFLEEFSAGEPKKNPVAGKKDTKQTNKILKGAVSSPMPLLTFPAESKTTYASVNLVNKMDDVETAEPVIRVYWTANKELAGIGVHDPEKTQPRPLGQRIYFTRVKTQRSQRTTG